MPFGKRKKAAPEAPPPPQELPMEWVALAAAFIVLTLAIVFMRKKGGKVGKWNNIPVTMSKEEEKKEKKEESTENKEAEDHKNSLRLPLLKEAFKAADVDGSGSMSHEELAEFGQFIGGRSWTAEEIKKKFAETDTNNDGKISLEEFQDFCYAATKQYSSVIFQAMIHSYTEVRVLSAARKSQIKNLYDKIDIEKKGQLSYKDMKDFGRFMNPKFDEVKLAKLMNQMDLTKDGEITYYEFLGYFAKLSKVSSDSQFNKAFSKYEKYEKGAGASAKSIAVSG